MPVDLQKEVKPVLYNYYKGMFNKVWSRDSYNMQNSDMEKVSWLAGNLQGLKSKTNDTVAKLDGTEQDFFVHSQP